jgi:hypothetical protein
VALGHHPPRAGLSRSVIRQLGQSRWKNENNGWMDLTKHWALKHGFLHACRHRPKRKNACARREPVANHGLAAVTLILLIAFALSSAFVLRHSKLAPRDRLTRIAVACMRGCPRPRLGSERLPEQASLIQPSSLYHSVGVPANGRSSSSFLFENVDQLFGSDGITRPCA